MSGFNSTMSDNTSSTPLFISSKAIGVPQDIYLRLVKSNGENTMVRYTATSDFNVTSYPLDHSHIPTILGITIPLAIVVCLLIFLYWHLFDPIGEWEEKHTEEKSNTSIKLKTHKQLASGNFGQLHLGTAFDIIRFKKQTTVVVKTLHASPSIEKKDAFKSQRHLLRKVGRHVNIVNLLGIVHDKRKPEKTKLLVEYCFFGNLVDYLQNQRKTFWNQVDNDALDISKCKTNEIEFPLHYDLGITDTPQQYGGTYKVIGNCSETGKNPYSPLPQTYTTRLPTCDGKPLSTLHLICFAIQIVEGMKYLISKQVIHNDLAARNILVASTNVVKITDFEFGRNDSYTSYFRPLGKILPFKWMALELIRNNQSASIKTNVWSFGVLLWELFTLAEEPYTNIHKIEDVIRYLEANKRPEKPVYCPNNIYEIMQNCWKALPEDRPNFSALASKFAVVKNGLVQRCVDLNRQYLSTMNVVATVTPAATPDLAALRQRRRVSFDPSLLRNSMNKFEAEKKMPSKKFNVTSANGRLPYTTAFSKDSSDKQVLTTVDEISQDYSEHSPVNSRFTVHSRRDTDDQLYDNFSYEDQ